MKRFFATTLLAIAASAWTASVAKSDDLPEPKPSQSTLSVQTQQTSIQESGRTRKLTQVVAEGNGSAGNLEDLTAEIQKQLSSSGLPQDVQAEALKAIVQKLEVISEEATGWAGRVVWTSNVPGETTVTYEPVLLRSPIPEIDTESAPLPPEAISAQSLDPLMEDKSSPLSQAPQPTDRSIIDQQVGRILDEVAGRLQIPAERLRGNANRIAERANRWQQERLNAQQQANNVAIEPRYRIGIDCQSVVGDSNLLNEKKNVPSEANSSASEFEVLSVVKDSPAEQAGLRPGDRVDSINGDRMTSVEQLIESVQRSGKENKKLVLEVTRNGDRIEFQIEPVIMAELKLDNMQQALPFGQYGFPFPEGVPAPGIPGWIMNRKELNEFRRNDGSAMTPPSDPLLSKQISDLQKEVSELKEMVDSLLKK